MKTSEEPWLRRLRVLALAAALFTVANALWAAWDQDATYDERFHLTWAQRLFEERVDSRELFRFDSKTPALLPAVLLRKAGAAAGVESEQTLRFLTRVPSAVLLVLTLLIVGRLSGKRGTAARWIGLLLASLDANLAAHASVATTDLAYTLVVALFALAISSRAPWLTYGAALGALLGVALAVKFTALLLFPVAIAFVLARTADTHLRRVLTLMATAVATCVTASLLYLGVGLFQPLGAIPLETQHLSSMAALAPGLPVPMPRAILTGIDASIAHNRADLWPSYLFGSEHRGGVAYYFLANWLLKTPLALIVLILGGLWGLRGKRPEPPVVAMGTLFLIHFAYLSFFFATQIGLRFALPCVALACALAARGLVAIPTRVVLLAAALAAAERVPYRADPIAFLNVAVPKDEAFRYTADSNLDYGQNRDRVRRYAQEAGLAYVLGQPVVTPGLFVVSANELVIFESRKKYRWLIESGRPVERLGFTHFAFSVDGESFENYMSSNRLAAAETSPDGACDPPLPHYPPGTKLPFEQTTHPIGGRSWVVCAWSKKGVDIGFTVTAGRLEFGRTTASGGCEADLLQQGQQAWFRIPRETKVRLCLREIPYRRGFLPYLTSGYLTVRGQGADVEVRPTPHDKPSNTPPVSEPPGQR